MIRCTEYDETGRLSWMQTYQDEEMYIHNLASLAVRGPGYVDGHYSGDAYHVDLSATPPVAVERPAQATALSGSTLTGLPVPSTLWINSTDYAVTGSIVTLDIPLPGTYSIRVESFPYLDWTGSVTV